MTHNGISKLPLRPVPSPSTLEYTELRLHNDAAGLQMTVVDEDGTEIVLNFKLIDKPHDFDLRRLRDAWAHWRKFSNVLALDEDGGPKAAS